MRHFRSKSFHFSWVLAVMLAAGAIYHIDKRVSPPPFVEIPSTGHRLSATTSEQTNQPPQTSSTTAASYPKSFILKVPFTPQAPTANWDELHNEACEEASAIMVESYFSGNSLARLGSEYVESELAKITEWEKQTFGYYLDIDSEETAKLLQDVYGLQTKVVNNMTEDEIKSELTQGRLVIWSANGRKLGNPNFRQPGPPYHMLVIKGWDQNGFLTNDPGTRKGQNYPYTYETLYNAAGTWSHNINAVDEGNKTAIVVWRDR